MLPSPFSNPFTRNRILPSVTFVSNEADRRELKVPTPTFSYEEMEERYKNMTVPNQLPDPTKTSLGGVVQYDKTPLTKDEWTKWRFIERRSEHGDWGDAWGKEDRQQDKKAEEFAQRSKIENAKLSAELEKDAFRKQLLNDIESGKYFPPSRLEEVDEAKRSTISTVDKTIIKEAEENGSNSDK